ncbi:glycerol-3-phosphate 1-O-acyltransferase [Synechococcus sp. RSCCF101]|nr:glycerol-3-phosphate 1-O-acyltransferase [Synechococcus sp. RSCCF101]
MGYLLGSIPAGWLAGRWCAGVDLRDEGSGSTGATNVLRVVGRGPALVVFLIDVGKGTAAVRLAALLVSGTTPAAAWWVVAAGLLALAGHIWPVWLGGRGGKAVATGLGVLLGISWSVGLACLGVFLLSLSLSRIVSLSSVLATLSLPLLMLLKGSAPPAHLALAVLAMAVVLWRHRSNLQRLVKGQEPRLGSGSRP